MLRTMIMICLSVNLIACASLHQEKSPTKSEPTSSLSTQSAPPSIDPSSTPTTSASNLSVKLSVDASEVILSSDFKTCKKDADCVLVATGCDYCCQEQALNKTLLDEFQRQFGRACKGYSGGVCDCEQPFPTKAACENKQCVVVEDDSK